MGVASFGGAIRAGQRSIKRARVLLSARIRSADGEYEARLRDLSRKGALIECRMPAKAGDDVLFLRGAIGVPSRVAWVAGDRLGLEFEQPIDENEVLMQIGRRPLQETEERFRRPSIGREDFTDKERQLVRVWGMTVGITVSSD